MQYERRVVDAQKGIVQITTEDERFYLMGEGDKAIYKPSNTWICGFYPKGIAFYKWLASKGWNEAEAIKEAAGDKGNHVHNSVSLLLGGGILKFDTIIDDRELTADEYLGAMSFVEWFREANPKIVRYDFTVFGSRHAGTLDLLCLIFNKDTKEWDLWIIDFKSGAEVWPEYEIQVTGYKHTDTISQYLKEHPEIKTIRLGILQLGYKKNKIKKWKLTEIVDRPDLWEAAYLIWQKECAGVQPKQVDYPLELTLNLKEASNGKATAKSV